MKGKRIASFLGLALGAALLAACASQPTSVAKDGQYSGFLGDYSGLKETKDAAGETVLRYVSPKLKPGAYQKLIIDPTQYYPAPQPTEQVSATTLEDIRRYMDKDLHDKLGARVTLTSQPGPGVLRLRPAITAAAPQTAGLKPYQYLPIAFVATSVIGRAQEARLNAEFEVVDSVTGERMGASVRQGVGAKLSGDKLTLKDVQPLIDRWANAGASFVASQMK